MDQSKLWSDVLVRVYGPGHSNHNADKPTVLRTLAHDIYMNVGPECLAKMATSLGFKIELRGTCIKPSEVVYDMWHVLDPHGLVIYNIPTADFHFPFFRQVRHEAMAIVLDGVEWNSSAPPTLEDVCLMLDGDPSNRYYINNAVADFYRSALAKMEAGRLTEITVDYVLSAIRRIALPYTLPSN